MVAKWATLPHFENSLHHQPHWLPSNRPSGLNRTTRQLPELTNTTTLGVGPRISRWTMPNRWLYISASPRDVSCVRRSRPCVRQPVSTAPRPGCHGEGGGSQPCCHRVTDAWLATSSDLAALVRPREPHPPTRARTSLLLPPPSGPNSNPSSGHFGLFTFPAAYSTRKVRGHPGKGCFVRSLDSS